MALIKTPVILASTSPRRHELIKLVCEHVVLMDSNADETLPNPMSPPDAAMYLAQIKAKAVFDRLEQSQVVIGCDTVVDLDGKILGKPKDVMDAVAMLTSLSNYTHDVHTGVCIYTPDSVHSFVSTSSVSFGSITRGEMLQIITEDQVMDKAGAYAIQGVSSLFVQSIEGEFYNIMGLPVAKLYEELKKM